MCGLVGVVTKQQNGFGNKELITFKQLLYVDALRGEDSTGIISFYNDGSIDVAKESSEACIFACSREYSSIMQSSWSKGKALVGHNRKKTIGSIKDETAHPFIIDDRYVFMHNGTLNSWQHLAKTEVDSEALGMVLTACEGDVNRIAKELERVSGAYATVWIDQKKEQLYLMRNKERPLHLAKTDQGWVWASELEMLLCIVLRNGLKIETVDLIKEHTLYSLDLSKGMPELVEEPFEVKKALPPTKYTHPVTGSKPWVGMGATKDSCSKNEFKRIKGDLLGKFITFYIEDYTPRYPNEPECGEWLIMGASDELPRNFITGPYGNYSESYIKNNCLGYLYSGRVSHIEYDRESGGAIKILVESVKAVPRHVFPPKTEKKDESKASIH